MFALVDCNNFYASCEKLFDPTLRDRPLVVLSNNDGCVVARSAEAKAIGVPMGAPWHELQTLARRHGIVACSSNYALYADLSNRVVEVLSAFAPALEVYSIDESFLDVTNLPGDLVAFGTVLRERVAQWVGLPVCVGIGPTKTLAKLANHVAKKALLDSSGVCNITCIPAQALSALCARIAVGEVWGVGPRIARRLQAQGLTTVEQLRQADPRSLGRQFSVVLERTVLELKGTACLELEEVSPPKQQIMCSRSFGRLVKSEAHLHEAVAAYATRACEKLRTQSSVAGAVTVFIQTNPFRDMPQYSQARTVPMPHPTSDTRRVLHVVGRVLDTLYRPGFQYYKAGVLLSDVQPAGQIQADLFDIGNDDHPDKQKSMRLMQALDTVNARWGRGTLKLSAVPSKAAWQMRRERLSPAYTTSWSDLPVVLAR